MVELAFDASARSASVCLIRDEKDLSSISIENGNTHSEELMVLMDNLLQKENVDINDIAAIYIANGPGSFTGIRIALSVAKGLAHAINVPLYPVSTLQALSYHGKNHQGIVCPIMDARRSRVYTAVYDGFGGDILLEPTALAFEELIDRLNVYAKPVLFVGDGIVKYKDDIEHIEEITIAKIDDHYKLANSEGVYMAAKAYGYKEVAYNEALPVYLRKPQAEREKDARTKSNDKNCV